MKISPQISIDNATDKRGCLPLSVFICGKIFQMCLSVVKESGAQQTYVG
jgi:hypothetical protein